MVKIIKKFLKNFFLYASLLSFILTLNINNLDALEKKDNKLIERISKDYTKKFCNGIGFGLSTESAMNFAMKENKLIFQNKKGLESLDKNVLANEIASLVVENCGYRISLEGEDGINKFEKSYIEMSK
tara:strand:+ start:1024 stop:1407 length:384 start_codon:yes stop_codon:yes gene_type:complete